MKKLRLYLDTSIINFLFAEDEPEKQEITKEFFENFVTKGKFIVYVSDVVIEEIEKTNDVKKRKILLEVVAKYNLEAFSLTEEAIDLANKYLAKKIVPKKKVEDARHIAIATINECDALLSWNYEHLANINKERKIIATNLEEGYNYLLRLVTPMEVMGK
ncbi:MAG: type II toxin-antitoxin system VapC family toxin [Candidatus Edwardsbacteria bacterium]